MRSRLATLLVLALLAWGLFEVAQNEDTRVAPTVAGGKLYPGLEPAAVDFVSMSFRTGHVVDIEREAGGPWRITYPPEAKELAQAEFVERVIENLALATAIPVEDQGVQVDPADVGLYRGKLSVTIGVGDQRMTLWVGDKEALGQAIYARREGEDGILLTSPSIRTMLEQFRAEDYVDKHLLRGLRGGVDRVRIERPEGVLLDARIESGRWVLLAPTAGKADSARITSLVRGLQFSLQVLVAAVAPEQHLLDELGLPNADQVARGDWAESTMVELSGPGEAPIRIFLERDWKTRDDAMYAIREDLYKLLEVDRNEFNLLTNEPEFFRDSRMLPAVQERAAAVRLDVGGERRLDIRRDDRARWSFFAPARLAGLTVDIFRMEGRSRLSQFLQAIDSIRVVSFCDPPEGQPDAVLQVDLELGSRTVTETVSLWGLDTPLTRATVSSRPGEGLVLSSDVGALFDPFVPESLRDLAPLTLDLSAWARLEIQLPGAPATLSITRGPDGWTGDDAWGRRFGLGHDLSSGLRGFAWRRAKADADYPCRVTFLDEAGAVLARLGLRAPGPGEPSEEFGVPADLMALDGIPGVELVVPALWRGQVLSLLSDQGR